MNILTTGKIHADVRLRMRIDTGPEEAARTAIAGSSTSMCMTRAFTNCSSFKRGSSIVTSFDQSLVSTRAHKLVFAACLARTCQGQLRKCDHCETSPKHINGVIICRLSLLLDSDAGIMCGVSRVRNLQ